MIQSTRRRLAALLAVAAIAAGCAGGSSATPSPTATPTPTEGSGACPTAQPAPLPAAETRTVTIETEKGAIVVKIEGALSPIAAGNFVALASCSFYDGVVFHRLVPGFVIQGGDPEGTGGGGPGYTIADEPVTATYKRGTLAMARTQAPDSQGSQFFIVLDDAAGAQSLAPVNTYAIIGEVVEGMEVVDEIAAMPNSGEPNNDALDPVAMTRVTVANP